jgi:16S rRNA U516 pseudouridylate synthase RsuA-like enzyme
MKNKSKTDFFLNSTALKLLIRICIFVVASRRSSDELIFQGKVTVNGTVCTAPQVQSY